MEGVGAEIFLNSVPAVVGFEGFIGQKDPNTNLPDESHFYIFELLEDHAKHTQSSLLFFFERS